MTVPCGGTGVSREKRVQTSSQANTRAPIRFRGFFVICCLSEVNNGTFMIEPNKYDIQTASILIDTAKAELDRKIAAELPEQTKRLAFYQGFCVVVLGVLFYLFDNHYFQGWRMWLAVVSGALGFASLLMSIIFSSGAAYPSGICKDYLRWLNTHYQEDVPVLSVQKDLLKQYQRSIDALNAIHNRRGYALRTINFMLILSIILGCLAL